ncbi:MAG: hypothetical protein KJO31_00825 [Gammaproteobacteria bacterium]|nr:hypothetical protein [Gammaproteobacteria bacterium]
MTNVATTSGTGGRSLVYVHGRDFKPGADAVLELSIAAISAGIERDVEDRIDEFQSISKRIAYYGDLANEYLAARGASYDEKLDLGDRRNALKLLQANVRRKDFNLSRYDRLPGKTAVAEFAADVAAPVLGAIGLSDILIGKVAPDVAEYWNKRNKNFRDSVRERIRTAICASLDRDDDVLLLSHGSGCIATYDVLWQLSHDKRWRDQYAEKKIDTWVTMGSPLADSTVRRRILGAGAAQRERFPTNIVTWHNMSAEDDYLCHDNTCADDYNLMLKQRQVSSIRDYRVYNLAVRYGKSNPHSSLGYLVHPRLTLIVTDWLSRTSSA